MNEGGQGSEVPLHRESKFRCKVCSSSQLKKCISRRCAEIAFPGGWAWAAKFGTRLLEFLKFGTRLLAFLKFGTRLLEFLIFGATLLEL
jgi:hypothetical protein